MHIPGAAKSAAPTRVEGRPVSELEVIGLEKIYGAVQALHATDLTVQKGEFVTILGPSGCGKSTLLRILTGILPASAGEIHLTGRRIEALPPERRDIGMVFQSYALFPHMTVEDNVGFGLRMRGVPNPERGERIGRALAICELEALARRMPRNLSGGQQQRVAIARAIVLEPRLLLFDEPLSNLDAKLREGLRHDLVRLHRETGATSLYVTHDQSEAMAMSDRIVVMNQGRIVETGTPVSLYNSPRDAFTAAFLGHTNLLTVQADEEHAALPWGGDARLSRPLRGETQVAVRPEAIVMTEEPDGCGCVTSRSFLGASAFYLVQVQNLTLRVTRSGAEPLLEPGARVALSVANTLHVLESATSAQDS